MKKKQQKTATVEQLQKELKREKNRSQYGKTFRGTIYALVVVAAAAVLVATLWMPVIRIYGDSMTPTMHEGDIMVTIKDASFKTGDLVSFYYGNRLLVKRVIAGPGDWVNIDNEGNVFVNNMANPIDESAYLQDGFKAYGDVTIELPYQVPESRYFVLGDHRETSADSRNSVIGCIAEEQIVGKIVFRVWPFSDFGSIG